MNKIEFSDVNRFLASLGLISIGLAFFLPWFVNQNNSLLVIQQDSLQKLTPTAQQIVTKQQNTLLTINNVLPTVSMVLIIVGFILLIWGIIRWSKRQSVLDKIQDEDLKSKEIQNMTAGEKRELIATEIEEGEEVIEPKNELDRQQEIESYIQIENSIFLQLSENFKLNFNCSQNVKIGKFDYDIIMKSKDLTKAKDRIIEIKLFKNRLSYTNIKEAATNLIFASKHYEESFKRRNIAVLIIIYSEQEFDETIKKYKREIETYGADLGKILKTNFFDRQKIVSAKSIEFFK